LLRKPDCAGRAAAPRWSAAVPGAAVPGSLSHLEWCSCPFRSMMISTSVHEFCQIGNREAWKTEPEANANLAPREQFGKGCEFGRTVGSAQQKT